MGHDRKYGKVTTEHGDIPEDEPVMVLRGRDKAVVALLDAYVSLCAALGSPQRHLNLIMTAREEIRAWQAAHPERAKVPDSERSRAWMTE